MTIKSRRKLFWLSVLIFLVIAPPVALYATGWRLAPDLTIKRIGGLFVAIPQSGTKVSLNGKLQKTTNFFQNGVFIQNLTPADYTIFVEKNGFWPWTKTITVEESAVSEARAFMLSQNIEGEILLKGQFESIYASDQNPLLLLEEKRNGAYTITFYLPADNEFLTPATSASKKLLSGAEKIEELSWQNGGAVLYTESESLKLTFDFSKRTVSAKLERPSGRETNVSDAIAQEEDIFDYRKKASLFYDENSVKIKWLSSPLPHFMSTSTEVVFQTKSQIRDVSFFPKRSDLILVSYENGVFAVEADGRGNRNIQPVYKGKEPRFAVLQNEIYVIDQGVLAKMGL